MRAARSIFLVLTASLLAAGCTSQPAYVQMGTSQPAYVQTAPYGIDNVTYGTPRAAYGYAQPGYTQATYGQQGYTQPAYAQPVYAKPAYTQPAAQAAYAQPAYAQPAYTQPGYAQPAAQAAYAQPAYAQPAYTQPGYAQPAAQAAYAQPAYAHPAYTQAASPVYAQSAYGTPQATSGYAYAQPASPNLYAYAGATPGYGYAGSVTAAQPSYQLDSGDRLRIVVFGQDGLTNSYAVDASGHIAMPLIGPVSARGLTTDQLAHAVSDKLRDGYIREPHVAVEVEAYRPFFILGEVTQPGQYPYVANMTAETAIAIAGGFGPRASRQSVVLIRSYNGQQVRMSVPMGYPLRPGDTINVQERWF